MNNSNRYSIETRKRALRLVTERQVENDSQWVAIVSVSKEIGCTPETLRSWVRHSESDAGSEVEHPNSAHDRFAKSEHGNRIKEEQLIFLISQPRSGSTLTQKLLGAHNEIYTRSEPWLMLHPAYSLKKDGLYSKYDFGLERIAFSSFVEGLPSEEQTYIQELKHFYLNLYAYYLNGTQNKYFLDKTPRYHLIVNELIKIFPKSKYIFLIRNPLAVLGSIINTWINGNWYLLSKFKHDLLRAVDTFIDLMDRDQENIKFVHYEEVINKSEDTFDGIFKFLGLSSEKEIFDYFENSSEKWVFGDPVNVYAKKGIDNRDDDKWQRSLKNPQYWRIMNDYLIYIGEEKLSKLGYDFSKNLDVLSNNMPADSLDELKAKTFPLFSFLNDTRECLIENQTKQKEIDKRGQELLDKKKQIVEKDRQIAEKDRQIAEKDRQIAEKDRQIAEKDRQIVEKDKQIINREKSLNSIISSKKYKLGCAIAYPYLKIMRKI